MVVAHELGHTIGFKHTDTNDWYKIVTREFSCDNGSDSKSVMCSGDKNGVEWIGFSFCDKKPFILCILYKKRLFKFKIVNYFAFMPCQNLAGHFYYL